ncbi:MAG: type I DNA topoisomerase [Bdellovibrionales bacterium CG10_big_fil_rev_8_21_14_0_10_45_34]|nr:MAG: type I DNA topoisomerase [Bdellovibrionales bacterium CG10_big_fil_rev_8_21_14_0_10_45_34]
MAKSASGRKLVIVESPTKAKTIRKFLPKDFVVDSCMGHIRDLPQSAKDIPEKYKKLPWAKIGVDVEHEFAPLYCIPKNKTKIVSQLRELAKDASEIYLATDEDREGESISWHLLEVLKPKVPVRRMVFHEITKDAIFKALSNTRQIDEDLVRAQEARRILDRLVGYTLSPLLWKKVAYGLSAGRVQSVAVRLLCEREMDRIKFVKSGYATLSSKCSWQGAAFESRLVETGSKKVALGRDFDGSNGQLQKEREQTHVVLSLADCSRIEKELGSGPLKVTDKEEKPVSRKPSPPFITSTLQQEASRKFGWAARETMRAAQSLYEQGFITYMRTDSTNLSEQAIKASRDQILALYGKEYLPSEPRLYGGKKVKGAQEAHEAIRPAGAQFVKPDDAGLSGDLFKLYDLIWKRTISSQMENARQKQVQVKMNFQNHVFQANGMTIEFPGFLRAYVEGLDDPEQALEDREVLLPAMKVGDSLKIESIQSQDHETKPPARFTEATLIQTLEKEGIGRPSTYAPTMSTILDRGYAQKVGSALAPTFTGLVVNQLLQSHFPQYVDPGFTSSMEGALDSIASGEKDWIDYLKTIYLGKTGLQEEVKRKEKVIDPSEAREIRLSPLKNYAFRVGRYGAYVCRQQDEGEVCASIPDSQLPADITADDINKLIEIKQNGADALGRDPETNMPVYALTGRYGPYVQLGDLTEENSKPKRMSIPPPMSAENISVEQALKLLSLPKVLGTHPASGEEVKIGLGRFGPYVQMNSDFRSIPKDKDLFSISLAEAVDLLNQPKKGRRGGAKKVLKEIGIHPSIQEKIELLDGRYGPYLSVSSLNASVPKDEKLEEIDLTRAVAILAPKLEEAGGPEALQAKAAKAKKVKPVKKVAKKAASPSVKSVEGVIKARRSSVVGMKSGGGEMASASKELSKPAVKLRKRT